MTYLTYIIKNVHTLNLRIFKNLSFTKIIILKDNEETIHDLTNETVTFKIKKFVDDTNIIFEKELEIDTDPTTGKFTIHFDASETIWDSGTYNYSILISSSEQEIYQWVHGYLDVINTAGSV